MTSVMDRRRFLLTSLAGALAAPLAAGAQPAAKVYRVGVVLQGGPYHAAVEGLRDGLKGLGFEEATQYVLHIRDVKGDLTAVGEAARNLEREKVDLIYAVATGVSLMVQRATTKVPIVFYAGVDPVEVGLVKSLARPGGRITGVHSRQADLIGKRLEILKEIVPTLRRVVAFNNPDNPALRESATMAREAPRRLGIELVERHVRSVDELRVGLRGLMAGEADAILVWDAMVVSQTQLLVETAKTKKLPTIFFDRSSVAAGGLASYGTSYYGVGRLAAKYVHHVLSGTSPADLPVERSDRFELVLNLKTAKALGLTIPPSLLARADQVIE
jgi:putative tryptophan/tyrosine transport system substrate-binding protein